ncbi:mechanosensitive ion channel family protein [Candidatus Nasuia deltocephalinicola]|uniref:mechanosensitive ion channel family protein n=1 Tax=Candidatus Nasuia deltocephalincola TaxID=1160784 RepID=UPI00216B3BEE|nr:mechanosensitive ion channel domain-containing protein [Candidatus Nasuia deltocephalinicola]
MLIIELWNIIKIKYFFFFKKIFFYLLKVIFKIKNINNLFFIFFIIFYFFIFFLRNKYYNLYKKIKIYRYCFFNIFFFLLIYILSEIKKNIFFLIKNIYFNIGNEKLNLISFLFSIFWIFFTLFINIYNSFFFNILFKKIKYLSLNYKILFFKIFILIFFFVFLLWGFSFMKLNNLILSLLGASAGIGLSVSIQKLINNYISSLVILFDKNFKIGDAISVNGYQGVITQVNNRYTILRNLDCSEILIPNEKILNEVTQNQSLYFSKGNLRIAIQISYNNDFKLALKLLIESLKNVERILDNPPAMSYITNLNMSGVDMELSFWILDAVRGVALVKSDIYINLLNYFELNNIELSYYKKIIKIID